MTKEQRAWARQGAAFWRAHHEAWKRSELNQREYCEAEGIPRNAFGNWRAQFKAEPHTFGGQAALPPWPRKSSSKPPLRPKHVWSIRTKVQIADRKRDLAISIWPSTASCAVVMSSLSKSRILRRTDTPLSARRCARRRLGTGYGSRSPNKPVKLSTTTSVRQTESPANSCSLRRSGHGLSTRQYARLVADWIRDIGLDPCMFGTHSLRRTKATPIYRLGIEVDDALAITEQIDV
jgi:hypothetical protein